MKTTTEKQMAANRRNSLKSTGLKTLRGKAVVSRNALKYGVLADAVVVQGNAVKESPQEYGELCRELHESLAPVGLLEEMLTGQIAATAWRLRRTRKAESGEIALSVDEGQRSRSRINPDELQAKWGMMGMRNPVMEAGLMDGWMQAVVQAVAGFEQRGFVAGESGRGLPHSRTLRAGRARGKRQSVGWVDEFAGGQPRSGKCFLCGGRPTT